MDYVKNLISVVIPCYNRVDVILPCIQSVLSQSYGDIEIIVADDGSTDGTEKLFDQLTDARIRYCRYTPNHGACRARNFGAQRARGEYIAFQDSDDYWHTDKLQKELSALLEWNADFVFCGMNRVSPDGKKYYYPVNPFDNSADALPQLLMENRAGTQTMLMRREVWENVRFSEDFRRYQDWDFVLRVAAAGYKLHYLPQALVESPVSAGSISASVNSLPALIHLYEAHRMEFDSRPQCLARFYLRVSRRLKATDPFGAFRYYLKSVKTKMPAKTYKYSARGG